MKKMMTILLVALFLAGCTTTGKRLRFSHPDAGEERFQDVSYQCERAANTITQVKQVNGYGEFSPEESVTDCDKFKACMAKKGFVVDKNGDFRTRKDLLLNCE